MDFNVINVTAAIIFENGKYLIAQRASGSLAGYWEFPGGKFEKDESPQQCLVREIKEELDIDIVVGDFFEKNIHIMSDKRIILHAYLCSRVNISQITPSVHSEIAWVDKNSLGFYKFAPADILFVNKIQSLDKI